MVRSVTLHLLESYFRHRWLYLLPLIIMMLAAGVYLLTMKLDYTAQGVLYVNSQSLLASLTDLKDTNSNYWVTPAQATVSEINELMNTDSFVRVVIKQTDLEEKMTEGPAAIDEVFTYVRKHAWASALGNNQAVILASDPKPVISYQLVNSIIENYIQWKMTSQKTESQAALDFFSKLITQYKANLESSRNDLKTYIGQHPEPVRGARPYLEQLEIDRLNGQIKIDEDRYTSAMEKEENAKLSLQQIESDTRQTYILMDAPDVPIKPTTSLKKIAMSLAIFLAVGTFLSVAWMVANYLLDKTVRFSLDVTSQLDLPVLVMIPEMVSTKPPRLPISTRHLLKRSSAVPQALAAGQEEEPMESMGIKSDGTK